MPKKLFLPTATLLLLTHLSAQNADLGTIEVISTNKTPHSIKETASNITVVTAEEIEEKGYQTVAQAIHTVSGITVSHAGGLGQQTSFFVRGADSGKVLVLLDGMRMNDPSTTNGTALLDTLTTENIQQIEIVQGGSSSIWGSNASAGVINLITKEPKEGVHGSAGLSFGSYNTKGADANLAYKGNKLSARIAASYLDTEGFSALAPKDAEADGYTNKNLNVKLGYTFNDNNRLHLNYNRYRTKTDYDDRYSSDQADDDYSHATSDQTNVALDYRFSLENYTARFYASRGNYDRDYYTTGFYGDGHNVYRAKLKEYSLINSYRYANGKVVLGLEYKNIDGFNQYNMDPKSEADYTNRAVFLSNTYTINNNTLLETNLRHDHHKEFENKVTYKIGIKQKNALIENLTASANYYTSYDAPSSYQLANTVYGTRLKPNYIKGYDISVNYEGVLTLTYFKNEVTDNIEYDYVYYGYYNATGKQKFEGIELEGSYSFTSLDLHFSANYTHLFRYENIDGTDLARRAKDTLNTSLTYNFSAQTLFGIDAQYIGKRVDTDGAYPVPVKVSTGDYMLCNLNFKMPLTQNITLNIYAKNIFDKEYQSVYGYATEGRSIYGKLRYSF